MAKKTNKEGALSRRALLFGAWGNKRHTSEHNAPMPQGNAMERVMKEANLAYARGEMDKAVDAYRDLARLDPDNDWLRKRLGLCLYRTEHWVQARVEFERVLRIRKRDNFASLYLGLCLMRTGKTDKAIKVWKEYFDPEAVLVQRELNIQIGLLQPPPAMVDAEAEVPAPDEVVAAVEKAIEEQEKA